MKKYFFGFILIILINGCTGTPVHQSASQVNQNISNVNTTGMTLDQALLEASDRIDERITRGTKLALLNFNSPSAQFSAYVLDELSANLVDSGLLIIIDRKEIDLIRGELDFQMSGDVSDDSMQALGRMLGAQSIVTGSLRNIENGYRIMIRVLNVESAAVEVQYRTDILNDNRVASLMTARTVSTSTGNRDSNVGGQTAQPSQTTAPVVTIPQITGTIVPGNNLAEKFAWLQRSAESHNTYILEINADENIAPTTLEYRGAINITIALRGIDENRIIRLMSNGTMFTVRSNVIFILENNTTLHGHNGNNGPIILVEGGTFIMRNGSIITGNIRSGDTGGGAVRINTGAFEMTGGIISGNTATSGGGVYSGGNFTMSGGTISDNVARSGGGGVRLHRNLGTSSTFEMTGGIISGNTASQGGGVNSGNATFNLRGGTITNNVATNTGGGVFMTRYGGNFTKTGGTITGYSSDQTNGNVVRDESGNILARRGHAVSVDDIFRRRDTTAGPNVNLSFTGEGTRITGAWEN